jgi:hypothetical protein
VIPLYGPMGPGSLTIKARVLTCSISLTIIMMREDSERHEATGRSSNWLQSRDWF